MNGAVLELAGLCPNRLSLEVYSNCVHKTNQWLHHDVVRKSVTFCEQPPERFYLCAVRWYFNVVKCKHGTLSDTSIIRKYWNTE